MENSLVGLLGQAMRDSWFKDVYQLLLEHYGPQDWWPGDTAIEIIIGAVLTQNTNWSNVTKAIDKLKENGYLTYETLYALPVDDLARCIRPSGYYNVKAKRLHNLFEMIENVYQGDVGNLLADETLRARENLLGVKGIGPETADSILLYGGDHPLFVVDAYTHRIFSRHGLVPEECDYHQLQEEFMGRLPEDVQLFNEYHALIVMVGKDFCKKTTPRCELCPLRQVNGKFPETLGID